MKLTKANYFTYKNRYISNSKLRDWEKDKHYFYRKHVLGDIPCNSTNLMIIGSAVDLWLTNSEKEFRKNYVAVSRRNLKNPPKDYTELTISDYDLVVRTCQGIESQDAYKELKGFKSQKILKMDIPDMGLFEGACGIPDWYKVKGDTAIIVDLKTTESINPKRYYWHCKTYDYFRQQALYQLLIDWNYPDVKKFQSRHLAVERNSEGLFRCEVFILDQHEIEKEKTRIFDLFEVIGKEKKFAPRNVSWQDAIHIISDKL